MKYLYPVILLVISIVSASAQTLSGSPDLSVLQKKWSIGSFLTPNSPLNEDPFRVNRETNQVIRDRKDNMTANANRQRQGLPLEGPPVRIKAPDAPHNKEVFYSYVYQVKVQNKGTKTIKTVAWDYVFFDPTTNREVGRHQFISKTNLKPEETDKLVMKLFSPPTNIIKAEDAAKKSSGMYIERIEIKSIQYKDGSVWQADSK